MNTQWLLYASAITGVSVVLLYIAYSVVDRDVVDIRGNFPQLPLDKVKLSSNSYQEAVNSLSQQTNENSSYKQTVGWMFNDRVADEKTTIQGYAVGWDYYEAQTCAARNLVGLQHWATSLDFGVVEPFVSQSYFRSCYFGNDKALRLSDYFDIDV